MSRGVTVSAALIVKNEERFLPGCLDSLRGRVDEIIVVDTGSTDASPAIASAFGARVLHHVWRDDFSAARNVGLDAVTSDWVLYIDADERLSLPDGGVLGDYLSVDSIAATVRFRPKTGYTRYREPRLFRSDPRLRFSGRIHETIMPAAREIAAREGLAIARAMVDIDHLGYDDDQSHKHPRNLPLLEKSVQSDPDRVYYWHHLAETLAALGRTDEALAAAANGLAAAQRDPSPKQAADASLITQTVARLWLAAGRCPLALIDQALERVPDDYGLWFLRGRALIEAGHCDQAVDVARRLRAIDPDQLNDGLLAFDRQIFRDQACELAALASLRLNRRSEAAQWFAEAARLAPETPPYRIKALALSAAAAKENHRVGGI